MRAKRACSTKNLGDCEAGYPGEKVFCKVRTCHGEKWGCHGSGLQNMVFLTWEIGLSRVQSSKNQLVTVRNGVVTDLGYKIWYFWREKWVSHVYRAPKTNLSRWEMGLSRGCCANNIDLSRWEMGLSVVMDMGFRIWYFWREKWVSRVQSSKNQLVMVRNGSVTCILWSRHIICLNSSSQRCMGPFMVTICKHFLIGSSLY